MGDINSNYRYFLYSSSQHQDRINIEKKIGKEFQPGVVYYKGKKYQYTEITTDPEKCLYPDKKVVAEGDITTMKYTKPKHVWG